MALVDPDLMEMYYKRAAKQCHPDSGGSDAQMARLNAARAMLDEAAE